MLDLIGKFMIILGVLGVGLLAFLVIAYYLSISLGLLVGGAIPLIVLRILGKKSGGWREKVYKSPGSGAGNRR